MPAKHGKTAKIPQNKRVAGVYVRKEQIGNCTLYQADCRDVFATLEAIDSIVKPDLPYGLSFMQRAGITMSPDSNLWGKCFELIKPGGHLTAFFSPRTYPPRRYSG